MFGAASPERIARSNAVCTALQLTEHWQDIREDLARARVYVPLEDLARGGCTIDDLAAAQVNDRLRRVLMLEAARTAALFREGDALAASLHGWPRLAVAGYIGGGRAALEALALADYEVLALTPRPTPPAHARRDRPRARTRRRRMSEAARRHCAQITRRQAANFYYGMRLLPAPKRDGLFAIYAFARRVDDIGDGPLPAAEKRVLLEQAAESLGRAPDGDPVLVALFEAERSFPLQRQSLLDLIDGVRMDVDGTTYETFDRARRVLPPCRRLDRAPVRGRVRQRRSRAPASSPTISASRCS